MTIGVNLNVHPWPLPSARLMTPHVRELRCSGWPDVSAPSLVLADYLSLKSHRRHRRSGSSTFLHSVHRRSAPDAAAPAAAPGAPGAPGADGAPGGQPAGPPNTSSNRRLQQTQAQVEEVSPFTLRHLWSRLTSASWRCDVKKHRQLKLLIRDKPEKWLIIVVFSSPLFQILLLPPPPPPC